MKKIFTCLAMLTLAMTMFTSCDRDEQIADYLISGNWKGNLQTYYMNRWGEAFQDGDYYTVWRFAGGNYDSYGYATSGYGFEADYNVYDDREFAYSTFRWDVRNGDIYIYYDDPNWGDVRIDYRDYDISSSRFRGTMYDWNNRAYQFNLTNVRDWNWSRPRYYAQTRAAEAQSDSIYISENGTSIATGRFAKALNAKSTVK